MKFFFFSSRRRHTRYWRDWSSDVCSSDLGARTIIVSNRLPLTASIEDGVMRLRRSSGGLATGLRGVHERAGGLWIGWAGDRKSVGEGKRVDLGGRRIIKKKKN